MLKVCEPSPPVPTMSTRCVRSATSTLVANSRITCAAAVISPIVSFLTRRPTSTAAIITGDISPLMMRRTSEQHLVVEDLAVVDGARQRVGVGDRHGGSPVQAFRNSAHARRRRGRRRRRSTSRWVTKRRPIQARGEHAARLRGARSAPAARPPCAGRRRRCWSAARSTVDARQPRQAVGEPRRVAWSSARRSMW